MECGDAIRFLRRKLELLIDNTWSEENEQALHEAWNARLAEPALAAAKMRDLQGLDRELEKDCKRFVVAEDCADLREQLADEFGLSRLTAAAIKSAEPGPLPADHVVFRPSGRAPVMSRHFSVRGIDHPMVDTSAATIAELAQFLADHSSKEVRVPRTLAARATGGGHGQAAANFVAQALTWQLEALHIAVDRKAGRILVLRDTKESDAARDAARRPQPATADEINRGETAMSLERFWGLIERAAAAGSGKCQATADALEGALTRLSADEVLGFSLRQESCMGAGYRWDLWGVAYVVNGGCSDDGFEYFRGWLLTQGRAYFEAALRDPARAADHAGRDQHHECEAVLHVAAEVYARKAKRPLPYRGDARPAQPIGSAWEEGDLPKLFPGLAGRFP